MMLYHLSLLTVQHMVNIQFNDFVLTVVFNPFHSEVKKCTNLLGIAELKALHICWLDPDPAFQPSDPDPNLNECFVGYFLSNFCINLISKMNQEGRFLHYVFVLAQNI
jgi:hypothetical protein